METEKRVVCHAKQELRVEEADGRTRINGLAVPYGELSEDSVRGFREVFRPGAFTKTLTENHEVFADIEHDDSKKLGRRSKGSLELQDAADGLRFTLALPKTTLGADTAEEVRSGLLDGVSIAFVGADSQWVGKGANTLRTIKSATLKAITLTSYPSYKQTVGTLVMRSLEEHRQSVEAEERAAVEAAEAEKQTPISVLKEQLDAIEAE